MMFWYDEHMAMLIQISSPYNVGTVTTGNKLFSILFEFAADTMGYFYL